MAKKTLNEHLFDQLDRLSDATFDTIDLETNRAMHIISVAQQVLNVAKFKLEVIQSGEIASTQFSEIDQPLISQPKETEIELIEDSIQDMDYLGLVGERIKIFNGGSDTYWGEGEVTDFMDGFVFLNNVETWNRILKDSDKIHSKFITRFEII